ncbi:MAG: TniQ family protein [Anaerolineae bacterium]
MPEPWLFDVLACRPTPYPGECLSGYLLRLAEANGCTRFWHLVRDLFPLFQCASQVTLLRGEYPIDDWGRIPLRTQLPLATLRKLTVEPWVEKFRIPPQVIRPNRVSPLNFLRGVVNPLLQVCPLCLQEQPYVRLLWRLAPVQVCLDHHCLLPSVCHQCGNPLTVISPRHRHLHCAACGADLQTLPVVAAPAEVLEAQYQQQVQMQFLLDPEVFLVSVSPEDRPKAIGIKFRYLRELAGLTMKEAGQLVGVSGRVILGLEQAERISLAFCLGYLEVLGWTWPDFAALKVPDEPVRKCKEPPFLPLGFCPEPECPNHRTSTPTSVIMLRDVPGHQRSRFCCTTCGRKFTRTYEGRLTMMPRCPPLRTGDRYGARKSPEEIARFVELGLQGQTNRDIIRQMGWGPKTAQIYWIYLGLEEEVHQAQKERRAQETRARHALLLSQVEEVLQTMLSQPDEEITLIRVGEKLGCAPSCFRNYREVTDRIREVATPHNAQVKQRCYDGLSARILEAIEEAKKEGILSMQEIHRRLGLSHDRLRRWYPELHKMLQQAVGEYQAQMKAARVKTQCQQIDEAASRLMARGAILNHGTILKEAGLTRSQSRIPEIDALLREWVRRYASVDG